MDTRNRLIPTDGSIANPVRSIFDKPLHDDSLIVNIGPSHPATHGTVQIIAELDGERVLRTVGGPSCVAKNRYDLDGELPLDWETLLAGIAASAVV